MIQDMQNRVNADTSLVHRGRWVNLTFVFGIDEDDYLITIKAGKVTDIRPRDLLTIQASFQFVRAKSWAKHWQWYHHATITIFLQCYPNK